MTAKHGWAFCLALAALVLSPHAAAEQRSLAQGWRFQRGDSKGAELVAYDDHAWRQVSVPHDWSIEDKPDGSPPFDRDAVSGQDSGYLPGGVGWYRRHLSLSAQDATRTVLVRFEAIYMDADVWINGQHVSKHHYGYSAFTVDLTGKLHAGDNVLAIRVDHADPSSRWYAGSGLIRPATLELLPPVHIEPDSVQVVTPSVGAAASRVEAHLEVANGSGRSQPVEVSTRILSPDGSVVARNDHKTTLAPGAKVADASAFDLSQPALWSPDSPNLYVLEQTVRTADGGSDVRRGLPTGWGDGRTLRPEGMRAVGQPENTPSSTVMERLGMHYTGMGRWYDMDCKRYDITAGQWLASPAKAKYDAEA